MSEPATSTESTAAAVGEPLMQIRDLVKHFPIRKGLLQRQVGAVRAVDGVSFDVLRGETLGGLQPPLTYEAGKGHALTNLCIIPVIVRSGRFVAPGGEQFSCAPGWKPVGT